MEVLEITNTCEDFEWEDSLFALDEILKEFQGLGFIEAEGVGWMKLHGVSDLFEINAKEVINKLSINTSWTIKVFKEKGNVHFIRYSHDEPTGARLSLKLEKELDEVYQRLGIKKEER